MKRFEFHSDESAKFWEVGVDGSTLKLAWGKIGTRGQQKEKPFPSADDAEKERDALIAKKVREGYKESGAVASAVASTPSATPKAPKGSAAKGTTKAKAPSFTQAQLDAFGLSVDSIDLPAGVADQFWKAELSIVGDLVKHSIAKLLAKGISQDAIDAMEKALAARGVAIGMKSPEWSPKAPPPRPARDVPGEIRSALENLPSSVTWVGNPPADEKAIANAEKILGITLPDDYRRFVLTWNGITLTTPDHSIVIYGADGLRSGAKDLRENREVYPSGQSEDSNAAFIAHYSYDEECDFGTAMISDGRIVTYEQGHIDDNGSDRRYLDAVLQIITDAATE